MPFLFRLLAFFIIIVLAAIDLPAQSCGKLSYGSKEGISLPHYKTFLDSKGGLWVNSRGGGVNYFNGKKWKNFTTEDGLLFSWSNNILEDKEGGIWISHPYSKGVTRYIDETFHPYPYLATTQDTLLKGQKEFPVVYLDLARIIIDKKTNEINTWTIDSTTQQVYLYPFNFKSASFDLKGVPFFSKQVLKENTAILKNATTYKGLTFWEGELCVWLRNPNKRETIIILKNGAIKKLPFYFSHSEGYLIQRKKNKPNLLYKVGKNKLSFSKNDKWKAIAAPQLTRYGKNSEKISISLRSFHTGQRSLPSTEYMFCTVWKIEGPDFPHHFILAEHDGKNGEIIQTTIFTEIPSQLDVKISFVKDKAGTYWYTNGHEIIRLFPDHLNIGVDQQGLLSNTWGIAGGHGDRIWFSAYSNTTNKIGLRSFDGLNLDFPTGKLRSFFRFNDTGITDRDGYNYFVSSTSSIPNLPNYGILKFNQQNDFEVLCPSIQGYFLSWDRQKNLLFGTKNKGLWILPKEKKGVHQADWRKLDATKGLKLNNVLTALEDQQGRYWMGRGSQGLAVYLPDQDTIYNWVKEQNTEYLGVQSMAEDRKGNLWFGTEKGVCFFDKNNTAITPNFNPLHLNTEFVAPDYLEESLVQVCKIYDDHSLIIGNKKGFFLLDLNAWYSTPRKLLIYPYHSKNGNSAGEINQNGVYIDHLENIWLTGNKGIVKFNPSLSPKDSSVPVIYLDSLNVGAKVYKTFDKKIRLKSTERTVRINFSHATNPLYHNNIRFRYRLSEDDQWSGLIDQPFVDYLNLSAGNYTFEVIAEKNGLRSAPKKLTFQISEVPWRKPLFWVGIIGFFGFVGVYFRKKEKEKHAQDLLIEKKNVEMANLKKEKEKLQVQAIVNQLNPHFINNALQWLQVRLDNNNDQEAVSVVGKLSENISTVFKNSRENKAFHSLYTEMTMAQNYLFIQKQRFKDKLQYEIPDFQRLADYKDIDIPLLMIQIHVENAVEHGIRNKKEGGTVKISFEAEAKILIIKIEDDGVGRKAAQKIGSKGTQNGVKMLNELETIFNKKNELKISQTFEDDIFTDENGNTYGTRMIIQLPRTYNYHL